jgi:hypothetical protein
MATVTTIEPRPSGGFPDSGEIRRARPVLVGVTVVSASGAAPAYA